MPPFSVLPIIKVLPDSLSNNCNIHLSFQVLQVYPKAIFASHIFTLEHSKMIQCDRWNAYR